MAFVAKATLDAAWTAFDAVQSPPAGVSRQGFEQMLHEAGVHKRSLRHAGIRALNAVGMTTAVWALVPYEPKNIPAPDL